MIGWFSHLERVVKWKPVEENIGEELAEAEDAVDHPVGQPLGVVVLTRTLDGFDPADIRNKGLRTTSRLSRRRRKRPLTSNKLGRRNQSDYRAAKLRSHKPGRAPSERRPLDR